MSSAGSSGTRAPSSVDSWRVKRAMSSAWNRGGAMTRAMALRRTAARGAGAAMVDPDGMIVRSIFVMDCRYGLVVASTSASEVVPALTLSSPASRNDSTPSRRACWASARALPRDRMMFCIASETGIT